MSQSMYDLFGEFDTSLENKTDENTAIEEGSQTEKIDLEYGDIIQLIAPTNSEYHESVFFVNYIDESKVRLVNVATNQLFELSIRADSTGFTDESILTVFLLDRSTDAGYARQKGLLPGVWVDIHFSKYPTITAEITDLEEDQIELTTYPALKIIYIDFAYRGIPEDIPVEKFVIREKPATLKNTTSLSILREQVANEWDEDDARLYQEDEEATQEYLPTGESIIIIPEGVKPDVNINDALREEYRKTQPKKTKGIVFGDYLDTVEQFVEVAENKKRYNIDVQINSYMDELLSTVPYSARTSSVMNRIHILVERFKELRDMYSEFDTAGNVKWLKKSDPTTHKPLIPHLQNMDVKLPWIVPIVSTIKKIYEPRENPHYDQTDIQKYDEDIVIYEEQNMINDLFYNASNEQNKYVTLYSQLNANYMTPMKLPANEADLLEQISVGTTTEAFIENTRNIYSSVIANGQMKNRRFIQQTYTAPLYYMGKELRFNDRNHYVQKLLTNADIMAVQSLLTLPMPVIQYSRAFLPSTSILDRVELSSVAYVPSFFLNRKTAVHTVQINDFSKELAFEKKNAKNETNEKEKSSEFQYLTTITQYLLNPNLLEDEDKFDKFLQVVIPNTWVIIRFLNKYTKYQYSFRSIVSILEPFMIYDKDISYTQYKEIRYMIKNQITELKQVLQTKIAEFNKYKNHKYDVQKLPEVIANIFSEKRELADLMDTGYKLIDMKKTDSVNPKQKGKQTNDEILCKILSTDDAELFALLMQSMMIMLVTPESILENDSSETEWMNADEKKQARNCATQVLAKKYTKIDDLLKDSGKEDVFFDKDLDETNYSILKKYEKEKKEMLDDTKFADFLAENLVQKHGISRDRANLLTEILIAGKKRVEEGHYAVLQITPKLPEKESNTEFNETEKTAIYNEAQLRTKYTYYIRKKNEWVHDESLDEMAFMDSNTLFCNLKSLTCIKDEDKSSAEKACEFGPAYFYQLERKRALKEFDRRYNFTRESLEKSLEHKIVKQTRLASKMQTLRDIQREKHNLLAYHLGLRAQHTAEDIVISPRANLLRAIYGQKDFIEKQKNIAKFVEKFCREPMVSERDEDPYWKYCIDTNTKLVPSFMYLLANEFLHFGQEAYSNKLNEIISIQGVEEDGYIYDRYTHEVIKKIDNVEETQYTESGFRVITSSVIQPDTSAIVREKLTKKERVFENVLSEEIYKIYAALSSKIAPFSEELWQTVNQLSSEFINNPKIIKLETDYKKESDYAEKKTGKKPIPYEKMRNKKIVQIVASVLFIVIQSAIPNFKGKKTFPGCVLSFEGYPLNGEENLRGIQYIACILKGISSPDIKPWDAIHKIGTELMVKQIQEIMKTHLLDHPKISAMFAEKREYLIIASELDIPDEHRVEKWHQFMPPLVVTNVHRGLQPISSSFVKEFWNLMRKGHYDQTKSELAIQTKMAHYGCAIIETIQEIVQSKTLLLKTSGNVPYLQNACCNEHSDLRAINYFAAENGSPISQYIRSVNELSTMMYRVHLFTYAAFLRNTFSYVPKPLIPIQLMEENMYAAMIYYCGLDKDNIPLEFRGFFSEIPEGYNVGMSLTEKIGVLKRKKRFDKEDLDHLMRIVRQRNHIELWNPPVSNMIERFQDVLTRFDGSETRIDPMLEMNVQIRNGVRELLQLYNPDKMYTIDMEDLPEIKQLARLKSDLYNANEWLFTKIVKFLQTSLKINRRTQQFDQMVQFLQDIYKWKIDTEKHGYYDTAFYRIQQYFKNAVYDLTHYFPALLLNRGNKNMELNYYDNENGDMRKNKLSASTNDRIHRYWNLSDSDKVDLKNTIKKYQEELYAFQEDEVLIDLIRTIHPKLIDLNTWINEMPVFSSLMKDREYFHLFDKSAIQYLDTYLLYTSMYEYIKSASERVILQKERETNKEKRRTKIKEKDDVFLPGFSEQEMDDEIIDELNELEEIDIMINEEEQMVLNERVAKFLMVFLNMYKENKKKMDYAYADIERHMNTERTKEKERIMKRFTVDDNGNQKKEEERKIEYMKKKLGLGIWNVGKQKSIFQYDKNTSDRERQEIMKQDLEQEVEELVNQDVTERMDTIEDMNEMDMEKEEEEIEREMFDISNYHGEEYINGTYYEEDRDENVFNEDDF